MYLTRFSVLIYIAFTHQNDQHYPCIGSTAGYKCNYEVKYSKRNNDHFFCDIDTVSKDITWDEFESKYYFKKPVVINTTLSDWTHDVSFWSKKSLLSQFGNHKFDVGNSLTGVYDGGIMNKQMTLKSYFKSLKNKQNHPKNTEESYIFDRTLFKSLSYQSIYDKIININNIPFFDAAHKKIKLNHDKYHRPYNHFQYNSKVFSFGKTGTGLPFHHHGESWLFLVYGRKRWFIYPPNITPVGGFEPGFSSYEWYKYIYKHLNLKYNFTDNLLEHTFNKNFIKPRSSVFTRNNGTTVLNAASTIDDILSTDYSEYNDKKLQGVLFKPLECMLLEGQIIYVPEFWWHQVLNVGHTTAIAIQINNKYAGYTPLKNWTSYHRRIQHNLKNNKFLKMLNKSDLEIDSVKMENLINVEKVIANDDVPFNAVFQFRIGNDLCLLGHRFYKEGRKYLINAILIDPTYLFAYHTLALTYMDRMLIEKYSLKDAINIYGYDLNKAQKVLEIAYVINPNNQQIRQLLIDVLTQTNQMNRLKHVLNGDPLSG